MPRSTFLLGRVVAGVTPGAARNAGVYPGVGKRPCRRVSARHAQEFRTAFIGVRASTPHWLLRQPSSLRRRDVASGYTDDNARRRRRAVPIHPALLARPLQGKVPDALQQLRAGGAARVDVARLAARRGTYGHPS